MNSVQLSLHGGVLAKEHVHSCFVDPCSLATFPMHPERNPRPVTSHGNFLRSFLI